MTTRLHLVSPPPTPTSSQRELRSKHRTPSRSLLLADSRSARFMFPALPPDANKPSRVLWCWMAAAAPSPLARKPYLIFGLKPHASTSFVCSDACASISWPTNSSFLLESMFLKRKNNYRYISATSHRQTTGHQTCDYCDL